MKNFLKYGRTALIVLCVAVIFLMSYLIISSIINKEQHQYAPDITGVTADGKTLYSLSDNLGKKGTVLVFFDCETPKAIEVMQLISQVAPNYDVDVMAISKGDGTIEEQLNKIKENNITVFSHTLFDTDGEMAKAYNVTNTPITYFIDKEGRITDAYIASISEKSLKKELDAID